MSCLSCRVSEFSRWSKSSMPSYITFYKKGPRTDPCETFDDIMYSTVPLPILYISVQSPRQSSTMFGRYSGVRLFLRYSIVLFHLAVLKALPISNFISAQNPSFFHVPFVTLGAMSVTFLTASTVDRSFWKPYCLGDIIINFYYILQYNTVLILKRIF